ncbi:NADH dehydrogenase FAD-containing subunit [Amycolatopsis bartoniae]|uniref:NADH dehydrogenase n=1 Tax=Amycolatopsis bartoniae TaxID=941986 RepID=A0A8H9MC44_9PSEU|nr:FAD-dependent oxidoreductase [Amycolatopsis bartoniae]MBB2937761.1 NADH dehydrogenase FAD-containing subunit [Amycolatopsis bartoniae]TVT08161.1 FAD-dependent oxidoreductase [Amycolatopsis bartoniae]GHF40520.1 NADH dehydrogenase [Amycolatopsis bartoniae]
MNTAVLVIGGGYSGVMAANRLTKRDDVTVTLVNPRPDFVERIRLHQLVGGSHNPVHDYRNVLAGRVRLVVGSVARIDAARRGVTLESGDTLGYDYLVYAVGSGSALQVPGAAEFAYPIADLEEAERLKPVVAAARTVTVVGAGPSGLEVAAELAELGRTVTLVCGGVLGPYLHPRGRRSVARRLAKLGVRIVEDQQVTAVTPDAVRLGDGRELPGEVTVWTAGFGVPDLAARSGLRTDADGRLLTDETLTSVDDERIVAAGDAAAPSGLPYRMGCQSAVQLGPQAAETVLSRIAGEQPKPADVGFAGQCLSLGRRAGIFQFASKHDTANRFHLGGRPGALLKELVCRSTVQQLAYEARNPGKRDRWSKDGERRKLLRAEAVEVRL